MSDLIDRRAAIDLFPNDALEWDTKGGYIAPHLARQMICELPSVQPDHIADSDRKVSISCAHENDVISRQMAIDTIMGQPPEPHYPSWYAAQIEILPSAQPEIIRCKDCKHRDKYGCCKYWKGLAMADIPIATDDYDFCSYAKRI